MNGVREMSKKLFTTDEINTLKENKYVKNVTEKGITYTNEFRKQYINLITNGSTKRQAFKTLGFNPEILGEIRMQSFHNRMKRNIRNNKSIEDTRTTHSGRKKDINKLSEKEQIEYLKQENLMLKAENELLKKMEFLVKQQELKKYQFKKDTN